MIRSTLVGQRSESVRRANLSAIVGELHARGGSSRSELVASTGLTRSAIRGLLGELTAAGLASEASGASLGTPGRPSVRVRLNARGAVVIALDVEVDSLAAAVVGLGGTVLHHERVTRPRGHLAVDEIVADLADLARMARQALPHDARLVAVGAAVAGVVRRSDGFVAMAPNLGWRDVPFGSRLARALGGGFAPAIANEADLGALAEHRRGAARGVDDVLFISGEVGVGGGLIVAGRPLTGAVGYGGEVGHLPVNPDGARCGCGSTGCWETELGERALLVRAGLPADGGREAVETVLARAASGDATTLDAIAESGRWLGIGLAGLVNVFNPRLVVLGGLLGRLHPFVARVVEEQLDRRALPAPREIVRVVPASLGIDAPLLGAAELAFEPLLSDPASWLGHRPREVQLSTA
jgi:predicted NBD/HSP70 family sugar kinase